MVDELPKIGQFLVNLWRQHSREQRQQSFGWQFVTKGDELTLISNFANWPRIHLLVYPRAS
jgi:hypothetical protein